MSYDSVMRGNKITFSAHDSDSHSKPVMCGLIGHFTKEIQSLVKQTYTTDAYFLYKVETSFKTLHSMNYRDLEEIYRACFNSNTFNINTQVLALEYSPEYSDVFYQIVFNESLSTKHLTQLFLQKFDFQRNDFMQLLTWFKKLSVELKISVLIALYLRVVPQEFSQPDKDQFEILEDVPRTEQAQFMKEDLVTCDGCGNEWDGYAQCNCLGDFETIEPNASQSSDLSL